MKIIKNNKIYFYNTPNDKDYSDIINILSDLNIDRTRINTKYCLIFSKKRILTKLKKHYKNIIVEGIDNYDNSYIYKITF